MSTTLFERPSLTERLWLLRVLRLETVGGLLMLAAAVLALVWANSRWAASYVELISIEVGPESLHLHLPLSVWAADFLLAFFFYLAGVELKHEVQLGTLSTPSLAAVPVVAALGGMVVPALIFVAFTWGLSPESTGWGIPMATDIAFALAVLAIMGRGLPLALRAFLLTLAVVDDLGAIAVIAVFYSSKFQAGPFLASIACVVLWWGLQRRRVRGRPARLLLYVPLFLLTWYLMHESGVHATVAGVALGLATRVSRDPGEARSPGEVAEHALRPFVAGVAVPLFAFASAGVTVRTVPGATEPVPPFLETLSSPVTLGVLVGLLVGKPIGVLGGAWLMARFTRAQLNPALRWADMVAVGLLAGIGFTVSLLIAELAYSGLSGLLADAKVGILSGTLAAALLSAVVLRQRRSALTALIVAEETDLDADGVPDVYQVPDPHRRTRAPGSGADGTSGPEPPGPTVPAAEPGPRPPG
ncbi:MAG: Na+/H+ antiporter NhaA [Candidatus Nanopelagicales bacterium]|nr:Na+/H+ antiporter NhaA [Candidatus Nanopelagicales bacterium]